MRSKQFGLFFVGVLALVLVMSVVSAVTILSDDFNDGNLNGWTVTNNPTTLPGTAWNVTGTFAEAKPGNGSATPSNGTSTLERTISTSGFTSIVVKYDRQLIGFDSEEEFKASWSVDGISFTTLEETLNSTPDDASFVSKTFNIPTSANNNANFRVRFECTSNAQTDLCRLDSVLVEGTSNLDIPPEVTTCSTTGNPGQLDVNKINFQNNGMQYNTFGKDDEWFPFEEVEVEIEVENNGNDDVDDVSIEWGLWNTKTGEWVIDIDEEDQVNIKDSDQETLTVTFTVDNDLDVDLEDLDDGNNYRLYVVATGTVDNATSPDTCVSDFESASIIIENDFVVLNNVEIPETVQCGETVQVSADAWNIGDSDQDEVSVDVFGREAALGLSETLDVGDLNAFDRQPLSFTFNIPRNLNVASTEGKFYALTFQVKDEDGDVYQDDFDDDDSEFVVPFKVEGNCGVGGAGAVTVAASLVSGGAAGEDLVVKATIMNNDVDTKTYKIGAAGFTEWADSVTVDQSTIVLTPGQSRDVIFTLKVNEDAADNYTFFIEATSGSEVVRQPVSVNIEPKSKSGIKLSLGDNWTLWAIGLLNVILVIVIIIVAV